MTAVWRFARLAAPLSILARRRRSCPKVKPLNDRRGQLTRPRPARCPALPRPGRIRPAPAAPRQRFDSVTPSGVVRVLYLADRIGAGKVKPGKLPALTRDQAAMLLLSLRYAGTLGQVDPDLVDEIVERVTW